MLNIFRSYKKDIRYMIRVNTEQIFLDHNTKFVKYKNNMDNYINEYFNNLYSNGTKFLDYFKKIQVFVDFHYKKLF